MQVNITVLTKFKKKGLTFNFKRKMREIITVFNTHIIIEVK